MKNQILLFLPLLFVAVSPVSAKNYYVSASGNNSSDGATPATAWQTISKINTAFANFSAGDSILFRKGDTFYGVLIVNKSGTSAKPIVISSYGTGAKPIISGFVKPSAWTAVSGGVYQTLISGAKSTLNMVTLDGVPQALGRYPNADDANGGYLKYESFSGATSITDNELTSATNWTGAEVVIRKKLWVLDRCKITAHSGTKLTFTNTNSSTYDGTVNFGYFFQNDSRTLDKQGEWYYNSSTKYLRMYFGTAVPSSNPVNVSIIDTLLILNTKNYINIDNIAFEGANGNALYGINCTYINVRNCDFNNAGVGAVHLQNVSNLLIENCTTNNILSDAIRINNTRASNVVIRGCTVKNSGKLPGMGLSNGSSYKGIFASVLSNLLMEYNRVDTTGYVALEFQGSNVTVKNNVVNYFDFIKDDAGGIYTYASGTDASPGTAYTNRVVRDNIVMNGVGAPNGRSSATLFVSGIYMDGRTMNVDVLNNTVFNNGKNGIHCNNPNNVNIKGNTSFNNLNAMSIMRWSWGGISGLSVKNNIFYPKTESQRCFYYTNSGLNEPATTTVKSALTGLGNIDSNYYSMMNPVGMNFEIYATSGGAVVPASPLSLEGWRAFANHDIVSKKPAKLPVSYKLNSLTGTNKFANGSLSANISGLTLFGTGFTGTWDNTGKISGGSLKISCTSPVANKYNTIHCPIGAVNAAKKYILRLSTYGTTQQGNVRAYIRKTTSPYTTLVPVQVKTFGTGRKDHEFLFSAPATEAGGSFVMEFEQNSGTTYIDNVEFYEADATVYNTDAQLRFEYNDTKVVKAISLDGNYTAVNGTVYNAGTLVLQPYTSIILVKDTSGKLPLNVTVTATPVKCYGDNSTVTVSATGGTSPYSGAGTFTVKAGSFIYTVTDAAGGTGTAPITVTQPVSPLAASASAGIITVEGGTTTVTVTASGGTAPYTGTGSFTVGSGTYTYTVTDANGCSTLVSTTIGVTSGPLVTLSDKSVASIDCYGGTASVNISAVGGKAPYSGTGAYTIGTGKGSLKVSFPVSSPGNYTALYYTVGAISSSKNYVLKFSTLGTTGTGKLRAALRQTFAPWSTITAKQNAVFGTSRTDHEFRFLAPPAQTGGSFMIEIDQSSGTTYIDNIAFFEMDTSGALKGNNLYNGQFENNMKGIFNYSFNNNQTVAWDSTGKITATQYFTVTDSLSSSSVIQVKTSQPDAPLTVNAVAGILDILGGSTTVAVTATGGTAPYTGTGSFSVTAGTYTYNVTDAKGCSSSTVLTVALSISLKPASGNSEEARQTVGEEDSKSLKLTAYPNPTNSFFNLIAEGGTNEKLSVVVYSFDGKVLYQTSGNTNNRYTIGANFRPGIYMVKVTQGTTAKMMKIVKGTN